MFVSALFDESPTREATPADRVAKQRSNDDGRELPEDKRRLETMLEFEMHARHMLELNYRQLKGGSPLNDVHSYSFFLH